MFTSSYWPLSLTACVNQIHKFSGVSLKLAITSNKSESTQY